MEILLMRHGETPGNAEFRYIGSGTDGPLNAKGREQARLAGVRPAVAHVYVTPMQRTQQTARISFPNAEQTVVNGLREMHFGDFENRTADEMADDPAYRAWVAGNCEGPCPNGESIPIFARRVYRAFAKLVQTLTGAGAQSAVLVTHGGVIMALMKLFADPARDFHEWNSKNCCGYRVSIDEKTWPSDKRFTAYERFETLPETL